jgi:ribonuclease BN (tRNA processing enzyme)
MVDSFHLEDNFNLTTHELSSGNFKIGDHEFEVQILQPANDHAVKFSLDGKKVGLTGDFDFSEDSVKFLTGLDIAVIDAGHNSHDQIVEIAVRSSVEKIYCTHLYYDLDESKLNSQALERGYEGEIIVGEDLMEIDL